MDWGVHDLVLCPEVTNAIFNRQCNILVSVICYLTLLCSLPAGLGYDYESVLAVSPLQQLITYYRAEVVLISMSSWAWELVGNILVPFGEGLGYKAFYPEYTSQRTTVTPSDMHTDEE